MKVESVQISSKLIINATWSSLIIVFCPFILKKNTVRVWARSQRVSQAERNGTPEIRRLGKWADKFEAMDRGGCVSIRRRPPVEPKCKQRARGLCGFRRESGWKLSGPASSTQRLNGVTGRRAHARFDIVSGTTGGADRAHEPGRPRRQRRHGSPPSPLGTPSARPGRRAPPYAPFFILTTLSPCPPLAGRPSSVSPALSADTATCAPSTISPASNRSASASCSSFCITRFNGRAP